MTVLKTVLYASFGIGTLVGVFPFVIRALGLAVFDPGLLRWLGIPLAALGAVMYVACARDFVRDGDGTPAFFDPPKRFVVNPWFRIVRNPMYVGVVLMIVAQAMWSGDLFLFAYAAFVLLVFHVIVVAYEEPHLRSLYGAEYVSYCGNVRRWTVHPLKLRQIERSQS